MDLIFDVEKLTVSAGVCLKNAERLLWDAQMMEFEKPPATQFFLSIISQEECAKAFILHLVVLKLIPWNQFILRATRDHKCKQLVGLILDCLSMSGEFNFDDYLIAVEKAKQENRTQEFFFPQKIVDAIHILRHEKIGRWESSAWFWEKEPLYDKTVISLANGKKDKEKQQSLYVELSNTGEIANDPQKITESQAKAEYERAGSFVLFIQGVLKGDGFTGGRHEWIREKFKNLFASPMGDVEKWQVESK